MGIFAAVVYFVCEGASSRGGGTSFACFTDGNDDHDGSDIPHTSHGDAIPSANPPSDGCATVYDRTIPVARRSYELYTRTYCSNPISTTTTTTTTPSPTINGTSTKYTSRTTSAYIQADLPLHLLPPLHCCYNHRPRIPSAAKTRRLSTIIVQ